jgi:hypothetical protein
VTASATTGYTRFTFATATPFSVGQYVDLVNDQYPYRTIFADLYVGSTTGLYVECYVPYTYVSAIGVTSMRVVRAGQLPFIQLPLEFRNPLHWQVAAELLNTLGDAQAAQGAYASANDALDKVLGLSQRRVKATRTKIVNRHSLARGRMRRFHGGDQFP